MHQNIEAPYHNHKSTKVLTTMRRGHREEAKVFKKGVGSHVSSHTVTYNCHYISLKVPKNVHMISNCPIHSSEPKTRV